MHKFTLEECRNGKGKKRGSFTKEWRENISKGMKKLPSWNDGSEKAKKRLEQVKMMGKKNKGENHHSWKGGVWKNTNLAIRKSLEYKLWRIAVFERDNYTCIWCGQIGGELNADHIKPFSQYPELRFAIDNGRTLCVSCHKKTDTYGFKSCSCIKNIQK